MHVFVNLPYPMWSGVSGMHSDTCNNYISDLTKHLSKHPYLRYTYLLNLVFCQFVSDELFPSCSGLSGLILMCHWYYV